MTNYSTWSNFVEKEIICDGIHQQIKESWKISKTFNVPYRKPYGDKKIDQHLIIQLKKCHHQNLSLIKQYMVKIADGISKECDFAVFVINNEGFLLEIISNYDQQMRSELELEIGSSWTIESLGTTAAGIALKYKDPIGIKGPEHYQERYHQYLSIGLPIYDTEGNVIYVLNLLLKEEAKPRVIDALMMTAVQGIERELYHQAYKQKIESLNRELELQNNLYRVQANLLNRMFDNVSDMVFIVDIDKYFIKVNQMGQLLLKKMNAKNLHDVYRNVKITDFQGSGFTIEQDPIYQVFKGKNSRNAEICIHYKGKKQYYLMDAMPFKDHLGRDFAIGILKDVTGFEELKNLKNQYKLKAEELENVINTISDGVAIVNSEGRYTLLNPACDEIFQYKTFLKEDNYYVGTILSYANVLTVNGEPVAYEDYPVFDVLKGKEVLNQIYKIEIMGEAKFISFNGIPVLNHQGEVEYAVISYSDITKIQNQQLTIYQNNRFIKSIMESLGAPMVVIKYPECIFEALNSRYLRFIEEITGKSYTLQSLEGKSFRQILDSDVALEWHTMADSVAKERKVLDTRIIQFKDSKDQEVHLQVIYTPIMNDDGEVCYITAVGVDITSQIRAKKEAEELAKMKEEYFSVISHELRSPIAVVHSAVQLLTGELYSNEFSNGNIKMLKKIEKNTYRLLRLVNNFLDITKAEAGYMNVNYNNVAIAGLTESLLESIQPIAQKKNIELCFINHCNNLVVAVDPEKYERILLNLFSNAIKFTEREGRIMIILQEDEKSFSVSVKDNGIGIPANKQNKIFDRFYIVDGSLSRKNDGTGIGLSLVKKFVELMDGEIHLYSEEGKGCEFTVVLPKKINIGAMGVEFSEISDNFAEKIQTEFADIKG